MSNDLLYYYPNGLKTLLGEVQQTFNFGFTIDGTKDSAKVSVLSYSKIDLRPFTIVKHENTNTWWIVNNSKYVRYRNDRNYFYVYELSLLGCIDLLNARDLTDCAFRSNRYTIDDFIKRLFSLSNFEYSIDINYNGVLTSTQVVDYIKTFENYSLLSAIREFLDGYNCVGKLVFEEEEYYPSPRIARCILNIYSKTGNLNKEVIPLETSFNAVEEQGNIDKNSYGSLVVSNLDNIVSPRAIRYPLLGTVGLKSNEHTITEDNGFILLPTNAFKVNKVTIAASNFTFIFTQVGGGVGTTVNTYGLRFTAYNDIKMNDFFNEFLDDIESSHGTTVRNAVESSKDYILEQSKLATSFEFYDGILYDAVHNEFKLPKNATNEMKIIEVGNLNPFATPTSRKVILTDKATRDSTQPDSFGHLYQLYWERGTNKISGFSYFGTELNAGITYEKSIHQDYSILGTDLLYEFVFNGETYRVYIEGYDPATQNTPEGPIKIFSMSVHNLEMFVDYVPMTDLKVVHSNNNKTKDMQLYNQTGKLTDGIAVSKLISSYANEISVGNLVKNADYYDGFDAIPTVGQICQDVYKDKYVINNVSLDFYQNEENYYIKAQFSLSKYVAVKSMMVNANSNIRDYGIPQTNNVARKKVISNYFYLDFETIEYSPTRFALNDFLSIEHKQLDLTAFIQCTADYPTYTQGQEQPSGSTRHYYYMKPLIRFEMKNQVIYKLDFGDNNIIGYSSQNIASAWTPTNFFSQQVSTINTPIGYTDENGEVEGISIELCDVDGTYYVITEYTTQEGYTDYGIFSGAVMINDDIYELAGYVSRYTINEEEYYKDALEVPVFELSCQLGSSKNILIGENIFNTYGDEYVFLYSAAVFDKNVVDLNNALDNDTTEVQISAGTKPIQERVYVLSGSWFEYVSPNKIKIGFYLVCGVKGGDIQVPLSTVGAIGKDVVFYRYAFNTLTREVKKDVFLILRNTEDIEVSGQNLIIYINNRNV